MWHFSISVTSVFICLLVYSVFKSDMQAKVYTCVGRGIMGYSSYVHPAVVFMLMLFISTQNGTYFLKWYFVSLQIHVLVLLSNQVV